MRPHPHCNKEGIMADLNLGDGLRKIVLAGIGALATTYEKSSEIVTNSSRKARSPSNRAKR